MKTKKHSTSGKAKARDEKSIENFIRTFKAQPAQIAKEQMQEIESRFTGNDEGVCRRIALGTLTRSGKELIEGSSDQEEAREFMRGQRLLTADVVPRPGILQGELKGRQHVLTEDYLPAAVVEGGHARHANAAQVSMGRYQLIDRFALLAIRRPTGNSRCLTYRSAFLDTPRNAIVLHATAPICLWLISPRRGGTNMSDRNSVIRFSGVSRRAVDWVIVALILALIFGFVLWIQYSTVATTV
jgi:hypothetical protein